MLTHPHIFYKIKTRFQRNSVLLTEHQVAPVVTLYFRVTHVMCMALHHTVVIMYSTIVTNGTLYHTTWKSTASVTDLREHFLLSDIFYFAFPPVFSHHPISISTLTSKLAGLHTDLLAARTRLFV